MQRPLATDDVRLAEFSALRSEIGQRTGIQQALIALNLTVAGTVGGIVASGQGHGRLFLVVMFVSATFGILWLDHHLAIHQIGSYIDEKLWAWLPSWERHLRERPKPLWWRLFFMAAIVLAFVGVAITAGVAATRDLDGLLWVLWAIGMVMAVVLFIAFIGVFSWGPARLK